MELAIFGAGCFWGVEAFFEKLEGITETRVGYTGGFVENPTYEQVKTGTTGHAEAIKIQYDPNVITYSELVDIFFGVHDPTSRNKQGLDIGHQYRSVIFYSDVNQQNVAERKIKEWTEKGTFKLPIVTEIEPATFFYEAEEYHQKYLQKNGSVACGI
ncbi:peptide-methionine (S)-S-oxide reductase MsrA [Pseudalkalibacillus berkeleyi]|uniref:Peptide methionine sulfoxide reductase MsrA n=1 Tax=Pseudalkalibacillus berkeleyi TaxID=1069813 RepID=A0ABS9H2R3_9BACL|nr:peptide-methionine (S)-S-oxide reductase MsrA [Pseudalkalibacillus berkeleyi]MCF6138356.1 peptide-methionine (S)-S-oxide reductase MsrA [Pseudalkalibacillus berkeleyi]